MKVLIVYYSRTGMTKKAAGKIAEALRQEACQVEVEPIVDTKKRDGALGWLAAARDAALKRRTVIAPVIADPAAFDLVVVGTPVWAFTAAPAVRTYCLGHARKAKKLAFFCTMGGSGDARTLRAMAEDCGQAPLATLALTEASIRGNDQAGFVDKVRAFVRSLGAAKC